MDTQIRGEILEVTILEGRHLPQGESISVTLTIWDFTDNLIGEPMYSSTQEVDSDGNLKWNDTFELFQQYKVRNNVFPTLIFEVTKKSSFFATSSATTFGLYEISSGDVDQTGQAMEKWYSLKNKQMKIQGKKKTEKPIERVTGDLKIKMHWKLKEGTTGEASIPNEQPFPFEDDDTEADPNLLCIRLISASNLKVMDGTMYGGTSDPRVNFYVGDKIGMTKEGKKSHLYCKDEKSGTCLERDVLNSMLEELEWIMSSTQVNNG